MQAQPLEQRLDDLQAQLEQLDAQRQTLLGEVEDLKLQRIRRDLRAVGLPTQHFIEHSALALEYAEAHEQARWVAHIILPDIITGTEGRSNDFRADPLVTTGTAVEADYFLKYLQPDSTYEYDGFGYDRGHLAPSADFRWSARALSESYFYSNMSPQRAAFNREGWAELESLLRGYVYEHPETQLYVVTGPVLRDDLPKIERSVNGVSIPEQYFKVVLDLKNQRAIGFLMPNAALAYPLAHYAVSIDAVEEVTGLDFFNRAPGEATLEAQLDKTYWLPDLARGDVEPLYPPDLPRAHFNTVQAKRYMGDNREITVCGTVVSTRYSRAGNLWLNLDQQFPNQIFSVFIRKKDLANFSYDPQEKFDGQVIAVKGRVQDFSGTPTMNLEREEAIRLFVAE
jgi:endonuclease G